MLPFVYVGGEMECCAIEVRWLGPASKIVWADRVVVEDH